MAEAILDLRLDTVQPNRVRLVYGVQNDYNSRYICARFTASGTPIVLEKAAAVRINAKRPDGKKDAFPGTVNADGTAKVPVAQWMLEVPGEVSASITAVTTNGALTTQEFYIMAKASLWDSTGEPDPENPDKDVIQTIIASENERVIAEAERVANESARVKSETERVSAENERKTGFAEMMQTFENLGGVEVSKEEPTNPNIDVWIDPDEEEGENFLTEADIAQELGDRPDKVVSQKAVTRAIGEVKETLADITTEKLADGAVTTEKLADGITLPNRIDFVGGKLYAVNGVGDFPLFYGGMFDTDMSEEEYVCWTNWANVIANYNMPVKHKTIVNTNASNIGTQSVPLRISKFNRGDVGSIKEVNVPIRFRNIPSNPATMKNVIFIGDSLIGSSYPSKQWRAYMHGYGLTNFKLIGRRKIDGSDPTNLHEGEGGYAWKNFTDNPDTLPSGYPNNYFWNPNTNQLDIPYYFNTYCDGEAPDFMIMNVGWNQRVNPVYYPSMTMDDIETRVRTWLDAVHTAYPSCKVVLNGMHRGAVDGCYPTNSYKEFSKELGKLYYSITTENAYKDWCIYCDVASYFDGMRGLPTEDKPISIYTTETEKVITDYIHPSEEGYKMHAFADVMAVMHLMD